MANLETTVLIGFFILIVSAVCLAAVAAGWRVRRGGPIASVIVGAGVGLVGGFAYGGLAALFQPLGPANSLLDRLAWVLFWGVLVAPFFAVGGAILGGVAGGVTRLVRSTERDSPMFARPYRMR